MKTKLLPYIFCMILVASIALAQQELEVTLDLGEVSGSGITPAFTGYSLVAEQGKDFRLFGGLRVTEIALKGGTNKKIYAKPKNSNTFIVVADIDPATDNVNLNTEDLGVYINNIPYQLGHYPASTVVPPENSEGETQLTAAGISPATDNGFILFSPDGPEDAIFLNINTIFLNINTTGKILFMKDSTANPASVLIDQNQQVVTLALPSQLLFERALLQAGLVGAGSDEEQALLEAAITQQIAASGGQIEDNIQNLLGSGNSCLDNDGNENTPPTTDPLTTASYALDIHGTIVADFCANDTLYEAECVEGAVQLEQTQCPSGCLNGACESATAQSPYCIDTDQDPAHNLFSPTIEAGTFSNILQTKGATAGFYATEGGRQFGIWTDYCKDADTLIEYFCKGSQARFVEATCPGSCSEGVCTTPPLCIDTDGENPDVKGEAIIYNNNVRSLEEDVCDPATALNEYSFSAVIEQSCERVLDLGGAQNIPCPAGRVCQQGRCIPQEQVIVPGIECQSNNDCDVAFFCNANNQCQTEATITLGNIQVALDRRIAYANNLELATRQALIAHNLNMDTQSRCAYYMDGDGVLDEPGEEGCAASIQAGQQPPITQQRPVGFFGTLLSKIGTGTKQPTTQQASRITPTSTSAPKTAQQSTERSTVPTTTQPPTTQKTGFLSTTLRLFR